MNLPLHNATFKAKIRAMLLVLFTIMTALGILGAYFLDRISDNSLEMMNTNLRTLDHTQNMWLALNETISILSSTNLPDKERRIELRKAFDRFERHLKLQSDIIVEGEVQTLLADLRNDFEKFRSEFNGLEATGPPPFEDIMNSSLGIQRILEQVYRINKESITQKNEWANRQATRVTLAIIIFGFFFFTFAVFAVFLFPDSLARPIQELNAGIREIARKNYNQRLEVKTQDEFGQVAASFNTMAEKLAEYENLNIAKILTEKRRIETIIGQMNEPIIGLDRKNVILFANRKALELIGMEETEVLGRSAAAVARENDNLREVVKELLEYGEPVARSYPSFSLIQHGKTYYFEKDILHVSENGQPMGDGLVIILKNITEFKEQDLAKTNFMATLSHELKTPLSAIDMSLALMQDERIGELNTDQRDLAQTIRDNSNRLLKMVNEILDLSKIETGIMELTRENARAEDLIDRALENTQIFLNEKSILVDREMDPVLPLLHLDVQKTTAVLTNFLTNAIRYSPDHAHIQIKVHRNLDFVEFTVGDEGPGIPEEELEKIFQRYSRSKNDRTKGTGLGLAISKEFIEKQGGRIWVKSRVGEGSEFGFALPV
ncbi:MAG: HAMP domain-containing protein [Lewinellaceae bacterium]|nr:HAMP domain-containing protein [Lewinellaceae bacterium]